MRETGWSLSAAGEWGQRRVGPSKRQLLLRGVIRDDNSANNGGILAVFGSLITIFAFGPAEVVHFTWGPEITKTIPWEAHLKLNWHTLRVFLMVMGAWCFKSKNEKTGDWSVVLCSPSVSIKIAATKHTCENFRFGPVTTCVRQWSNRNTALESY